jgi:hypothetical protein
MYLQRHSSKTKLIMYGIELCYCFDDKTKISHRVHRQRVVSKYQKVKG